MAGLTREKIQQLREAARPEGWQWRHFGDDPENPCRVVDYSAFEETLNWDVIADDIMNPAAAELIAALDDLIRWALDRDEEATRRTAQVTDIVRTALEEGHGIFNRIEPGISRHPKTVCPCLACNPEKAGQRMFLCDMCGNKRCPHATDHTYRCTGSNEMGQVGSRYADGTVEVDTEAAVARMQALADAWQDRGDSMIKYANTSVVPDDIKPGLIDAGEDFINRADVIRRTLSGELG